MGIKTVIRSKKNKKSRFAITYVSLEDLSKIFKEFRDLNYVGYVPKSSKHVPTESYFYPARQIAKFTIRFSMSVGPIRT